jgi:hypothetical protein
VIATTVVLTQVPISHERSQTGTPTRTAESAKLRAMNAYGNLPLAFEPNQGQFDSQVQFVSRGNGYGLFLTADEAVLELVRGREKLEKPTQSSLQAGRHELNRQPGGHSTQQQRAIAAESQGRNVFRMKLVGANPKAAVAGVDELPGKSNYFIGNDPSKWRTNVATYGKVHYENVYRGIDLVYYGNQSQLEYDFVIAPGADPATIQFSLRSHKARGSLPHSNGLEAQAGPVPRIDSHGDLVLAADDGELRLHRPMTYQEIKGIRRNIASEFVIHEMRSV